MNIKTVYLVLSQTVFHILTEWTVYVLADLIEKHNLPDSCLDLCF